MAKNEDDFWNESLNKSNFFDDDDDDASSVDADVLNLLPQENTTLPIHSIISNKCLSIILDDINSTIDTVNPPPEETIKKMFLGENTILNVYKTLNEKLLLLDSAIDIGDGNIIIAVVIFLKKSLKRNIFLNHLSKRKIAVKHYVNYLIESNELTELVDLYMATGNISNLKDIYCILNRDTLNKTVLLKKLEQFSTDHSNLFSNDEKTEIQENISFIDWQIQNKQTVSSSLIEQLIELCKTEWGRDNGDDQINNFKSKFKLDDFQFDWIIMNVLCKMNNWKKLTSTFIKSVWVIKKRALKSAIRPELFVAAISKYKPPSDVMEQFLSCVGDSGKSLHLAEKLEVHSYVINYYIEQKDRDFLINYLDKIQPGHAARELIDSALNNSAIKWKN